MLGALVVSSPSSAQTSGTSPGLPATGSPLFSVGGGDDGPPAVDPHSAAATSRAGIPSFWGIEWHADSAAVAERLGPPILAVERRAEMRVFVYTVFQLDRDGFLHLWIRDGEGLVGGSYEPVVDDCTGMLRRMVDLVKQRHRGVPYATRGGIRASARGQDVCRAAMDGEADFAVEWRDGAGNRIRVGASPGTPGLRMIASTPSYRWWWRNGGPQAEGR